MRRLATAALLLLAAALPIRAQELPDAFRLHVDTNFSAHDEISGLPAEGGTTRDLSIDTSVSLRLVLGLAGVASDATATHAVVRVEECAGEIETRSPDLQRRPLGASLSGSAARVQWLADKELRVEEVTEGTATDGEFALLRTFDPRALAAVALLAGATLEEGAEWQLPLEEIEKRFGSQGAPSGWEEWTVADKKLDGNARMRVVAVDGDLASIEVRSNIETTLEVSGRKGTERFQGLMRVQTTLEGTWKVDRRLRAAVERDDSVRIESSGRVGSFEWKRTSTEKTTTRLVR
ncbi:MAG: hypothetical protein HY720_25200 [Planctomycetes bacterium]|nr:hypothetical protein [Planctomycetota bacterium]